MEKGIKITIVIGTLNRPNVVLPLVHQLVTESKKILLEVLVIDQSTTENYKILQNKFPKLTNFKLIHFDKPNTVKYLNYGWQNAKAPVVLYLDDDVTITEKTIKSHLEAYKNFSINGVAGRVINDGEIISHDSDVGKIKWFGAKFSKNFSYEKSTFVDFPYGCNMSFRKEVLKDLGGFDEKLLGPIYAFNEVDLGYRINKLSKNSILFLPDALVYHHQYKRGGTRNDFSAEDVLQSNQLNYRYFLNKNFSVLENIVCFLRRIPYELKRSWIPALIPTIITAFLIFIRFYRAGDFFSFNFDEEYQAHLAYEQIKNFHLIWIGVSASNIGYYLGPGFTYLNALLFNLTGGDPISISYFAPLMGVTTGLSLYFIVKEIFNKKVAFLSMIFYLGSTLVNFYDRRFWNPLPIPFVTIWLFYSLFKAQKDSRFFILTSVLLAVSLHIHLALLVFWPLVIFYVIKNIREISFKTWAISIGLYLIIISPLIVFDFVHNFDNLMTPIRYIQNKNIEHQRVTAATINSHWHVWFSSLSRYWYIKPVTDIQNEHCLGQQCLITPGKIWLSLLSLTSIFYLIYKSFKDRKKRYLLLMTVFSMIFFVLYPGYSAEYYLLNFFVLFPIILGLFFEKIPNWLTIIVVSLFVIFNSLTIINSTQAKFGLNTKKIGIKRVMAVIGDKPYALENYGKDPRKYHSYGGWRYLFRVYGKKPARAFADEFFGWIYSDEISNEKPVYRVVVSEDIEHNKSKEKPVLKFKEGAYYFYVFKY